MLSYRCTSNYGIPHSWNLGIELAIDNGAEIMTLLTDDSYPNNSFQTAKIIDFYGKNCDKLDLLSLPMDKSELADVRRRFFVYDCGMTFHKKLVNRLHFDEQLVHTFTDYKFSFDIAARLGKIVIYPQIVIDQIPYFSNYAKSRYLPEWILYLIFRNSIYWARGEKRIKYKILIIGLFYLMSIAKWLPKSVKAGRSVQDILFAVMNGTLDGLLGLTGITRNLEKISGGRFKF